MLGSFLFCASTDALGADLTGRSNFNVLGQVHETPDICRFEDNGVDRSIDSSSGSDVSTPPSPIGPPMSISEIPSDESDDEFVVFREGRRRILEDSELSFRYTGDQIEALMGTPVDWEDPGLSVKVYIDDMNNLEKVCHVNAISRITEGKTVILAHAQHSEENFKCVKAAASDIKMTVNDKKTQLLCISGNQDSVINSYIRTDSETEIVSGDELKILGFWFGRRPNVDVHVQKLAAKFRTKLWALRHLKKGGMGTEDLLRIYLAVLRPVLDYASPTYHSLLTKQQTVLLDSLQKRAAKIIFGISSSYSDIVSSGQLKSLEQRRRELCISFAQKAASSAKFGSSWFPRKQVSEYNIRNPEIYLDTRARTERMRKNPLSYMRRELNTERNK